MQNEPRTCKALRSNSLKQKNQGLNFINIAGYIL
jgi:hypothetical protein